MKKIKSDFIDKVPESMNKKVKDIFMNNFDIDKFSKIITHYAFRNGPVEDMHADGKLSQEDMKTLNKYMVNRVAGILQLIKNEQWFKLVSLIEIYKIYGADWDKAEPDNTELEAAIKLIL